MDDPACEQCQGTGRIENTDCDECAGTGMSQGFAAAVSIAALQMHIRELEAENSEARRLIQGICAARDSDVPFSDEEWYGLCDDCDAFLTKKTPRQMTEPSIVIDGAMLTEGQAMTVRVAVSSFLMSLTPKDMEELGPIGASYKARATEVERLLVQAPTRKGAYNGR